jgi:predicted methyltransferase
MRTRLFIYLFILLSVSGIISPASAQSDERLQTRVYYAINDPSRPMEDSERDFDRRPIEVLHFLGISEGMTVLELMAGRGYYTELLSAAVGTSGKVYAHNEFMAMRMRYSAYEKSMDNRLANGRLNNVKLLIEDLEDLQLKGIADVATLILNLHDLYIYGGEEKVVSVLNNIMTALKPGGILGIVDHIGSPEIDNIYLHRVDPVIVDELLFHAGFIVTGRSDILNNPDDDHSLHVFDPAIKGQTDRLIIRAIKPNYR